MHPSYLWFPIHHRTPYVLPFALRVSNKLNSEYCFTNKMAAMQTACEMSLALIFTTVCLPLICSSSLALLWHTRGDLSAEGMKKWDQRRRNTEFRKNTPRPLNVRSQLERRLSIGREIVDQKDGGAIELHNGKDMRRSKHKIFPRRNKGKMVRGRVDDQLKSGFFKLPPELRMQIYEEVLGDHVFHIFFNQDPKNRRMLQNNCNRNFPCRHPPRIPGIRKEQRNSLLPILMSCRRM
jgi:hypothetical protein